MKSKNNHIIKLNFYKKEEIFNFLETDFLTIKNKNLLINLCNISQISRQEIEPLILASQKFKEAENKSFVVVLCQISHEEFPENFTIVPTEQEAFDVIEMEEIERDLFNEIN